MIVQLTGWSVGKAAGVGGLGWRGEVRVLVASLYMNVNVLGMTAATAAAARVCMVCMVLMMCAPSMSERCRRRVPIRWK